MALIIAIVLILIITIKVGNEKQESYKTDALIASNLRQDERIKMFAEDRNLELLLKEKLDDPSKYEEVMEELSDVFSQVLLHNELEAFSYYPKNKYLVEYDMALRMLMAKRGKIPRWECSVSGAFPTTMHLPSQVSDKGRRLRKCFKKLMGWVEQELVNHDVPIRLIVVVGPDEVNSLTEKYVSRGMDFYWDDYQKIADPEALTDNIYGFRWSLK